MIAGDHTFRSGNEEGGLAKNVTATKDSDTVECEGDMIVNIQCSGRMISCCELITYSSS